MPERESFADHFSARASRYAQYRPGYPPELFAYLASLCSIRQAVLDCASGSGQSASQFTGHFDTVIASDASYQQLKNADRLDGLYYVNCLAEQTPFADQCFDLITVAQALHWFGLERFYAEIKRLLKPNAVFAVWTYNLMQINPAIDEIIQHFYADIVGAYWPFERKLVEQGYRDLEFPFTEHAPPQFAMHTDWSLEHLLGYLSTWSAVKRYRETQGKDPLQEIRHDLTSAWGTQAIQRVNWPLSLRVGTI